jgi:hypothetical protein
MPQLNIRDVFAAAEDQKVLPAPELTVLPARPIAGSRLGHSEWTNISFVTIALAGGLFSAFYFFNAADVVQAAGRLGREFLYPQPRSDVTSAKSAVPENPVAGPAATSGSSRSGGTANSGSGPFAGDYWSNNLARPASPASANGIDSNPVGGTSTATGSALNQLSTLRRGGDNLFQALYETVPVKSQVNNVTNVVRSTATASRKTVSATGKLVLHRTPISATAISTANGTSPVARGAQTSANAAQSAPLPIGSNPGLGNPGLANQLGLGNGRGGVGGGGGGVGGAVGGLGLGRGGH